MPGKKGFGAILEYLASTGPDVYTAIANVTKLRPFAPKVDVIDVTSHDSPSEFREKMAGLKDMGQATFDLNYDNKTTSHAWLLTELGNVHTFKLTFPGSSPKVASFSGFVASMGPEVPYDNKQTCSVVIEITSVVTIT